MKAITHYITFALQVEDSYQLASGLFLKITGTYLFHRISFAECSNHWTGWCKRYIAV